MIRLVLQRSFRRRRRPFSVAMACSPRQRISAWQLLCHRLQPLSRGPLNLGPDGRRPGKPCPPRRPWWRQDTRRHSAGTQRLRVTEAEGQHGREEASGAWIGHSLGKAEGRSTSKTTAVPATVRSSCMVIRWPGRTCVQWDGVRGTRRTEACPPGSRMGMFSTQSEAMLTARSPVGERCPMSHMGRRTPAPRTGVVRRPSPAGRRLRSARITPLRISEHRQWHQAALRSSRSCSAASASFSQNARGIE